MNAKINELTSMNISKSVIFLAWPVVLRLAFQMIVGLVDLAFVGSLGPAAIAAVGIGNNLLWFIVSATTAFSVGTTTLVAQNVGAKDYKQAAEVSRQSIMITFLIATAITVLAFSFAQEIISLLIIGMENPDPLVLEYGITYFQITAIGFPFFFTLMVLNSILQGTGDMKTPLKIMFLINIFNIVFDYLLIFGIGPFPELGVAGAAIASTCARILAFSLTLYILLSGKSHFRINWPEKFKLDWQIIKQVAKIGLPAAGEQLVRNSGTTLLTMITATFGTQALAANLIVLRGVSIANMPAFGFNMAATTLVGQNLGAKKPDRAEKTGYTTVKMAGTFMLLFGIAIFFCAQPITMIFTSDPEVISLAVHALRVVAFSFPFLGILLAFAGSLRGAGDTTWVMIITVLGVWGTRVALAFLLAVILGIGFVGIWIAFAVDFAVRALLFYFRFRTGKWKEIKLRAEKNKISI